MPITNASSRAIDEMGIVHFADDDKTADTTLPLKPDNVKIKYLKADVHEDSVQDETECRCVDNKFEPPFEPMKDGLIASSVGIDTGSVIAQLRNQVVCKEIATDERISYCT